MIAHARRFLYYVIKTFNYLTILYEWRPAPNGTCMKYKLLNSAQGFVTRVNDFLMRPDVLIKMLFRKRTHQR
jgi:hypothetical protein